MKATVWFIVLAAVAGIVYGLWRARAKWEERNRASEERFASFMAGALPAGVTLPAAAAAPAAPKPTAAPAAPKPNNEVVLQRLLLEAAAKAGEAGEPALSIQLYAKLISRYPQSSFCEQARAAVAAQKKKLAPKPA